ncbi:hypothetical protein C0J52_24617 [Blattella germanica]|nr:hypothetical protein C0J52_24617 [Blattella germanica]
MATPVLLYGSEAWIPTKQIKNRIQSKETYFRRRTIGFAKLDHIRNEDIRLELNRYALNRKINKYCRNWLIDIQRMDVKRLPKLIYNYKPIGRRDVGRPFKR